MDKKEKLETGVKIALTKLIILMQKQYTMLVTKKFVHNMHKQKKVI